MNAISTIVKQLYRTYEYTRNRWPIGTAWVVVTPMILVAALFTLEFPIPAVIGAVVIGAELRYSNII